MDADIRERLAAGQHREAFELLLERSKDKAFRLAFAMLRDQAAAEGVTQDIFIKVWKALPGYNGAAAISTWLYTIARNTCLTELKRRARRPAVSLEAPGLAEVVDAIPARQCSDPESGAGMDAHLLLA
jgi:RNA polymerase sigma-70 factor (ECF subfamily)